LNYQFPYFELFDHFRPPSGLTILISKDEVVPLIDSKTNARKFERAAVISAATGLPLCNIFCRRSGIAIKRWQASLTCVARAQSRLNVNIGQV
jgi:hypothetical protein